MKLYMIRWPDGDTSIVGAPTKEEAYLFADCEWGDPHGAEVTELSHIALLAKPKIDTDDEGDVLGFDVEIGCFDGPPKFDPLREIAYPRIAKAYLGTYATQEQADAALRKAFVAERKRKLNKPRVTGSPMVEMYLDEIIRRCGRAPKCPA